MSTGTFRKSIVSKRDVSLQISTIMKKISILRTLSAIIIAFLCSSCVEIAMLTSLAVNPEDVPVKFTKPRLIRLDSEDASQKLVLLNWNDDLPSMDMSKTNSGEGWTGGMRHTPNVYKFFQKKYYSLTLDFKKKTFVETRFDGTQLPEVKGTWRILK